jgi:hypothetical protein
VNIELGIIEKDYYESEDHTRNQAFSQVSTRFDGPIEQGWVVFESSSHFRPEHISTGRSSSCAAQALVSILAEGTLSRSDVCAVLT